jgi:hypothetical protein
MILMASRVLENIPAVDEWKNGMKTSMERMEPTNHMIH